MLKQRIITSAFLIPVAIWFILFSPVLVWALGSALILLLCASEWSAFANFKSSLGSLVFIAMSLVAMGIAYSNVDIASTFFLWMTMVAITWGLIVVWLFIRQRHAELKFSRMSLIINGVWLLSSCWLALLWLVEQNMRWEMLGAFILIWSADIGAYFAGRKWGKNKLASSISPGKTLEGVLGGLVLALITSFIFMYTTPAYSLVSVYGNIALILAIIVLVIISVAGDLFESAMKRQSGVKDSGNILPGHGGILDRIDSLISVAPVFVALLLWFKVAA